MTAIAITDIPVTVRTDPMSPPIAITDLRQPTVKAIMAPPSGDLAMAVMGTAGMDRVDTGTASGAVTDTTIKVTDTAANATGKVDTDIPATDTAGKQRPSSDASAVMERADRLGQLAPLMLGH